MVGDGCDGFSGHRHPSRVCVAGGHVRRRGRVRLQPRITRHCRHFHQNVPCPCGADGDGFGVKPVTNPSHPSLAWKNFGNLEDMA